MILPWPQRLYLANYRVAVARRPVVNKPWLFLTLWQALFLAHCSLLRNNHRQIALFLAYLQTMSDYSSKQFSLQKLASQAANFYRHHKLLLRFLGGLLLWLVVLGYAAESFWELTEGLYFNNLEQFDKQITRQVINWRSKQATNFMQVLTLLGNEKGITIQVLLFGSLIFLGLKKWPPVVQLVLVVVVSSLVNIWMKEIIGRERPVEYSLMQVASKSYPSGHSQSSMALYGFLIYLALDNMRQVWLKVLLTITGLLLILSIGLSRVYLGVHYPSDVLAGFLNGFLFVGGAVVGISIFRYYKRHYRGVKKR